MAVIENGHASAPVPAINANSTTFKRAKEFEDEDVKQVVHNIQAESWKSWPNEAGVSHQKFRHQTSVTI